MLKAIELGSFNGAEKFEDRMTLSVSNINKPVGALVQFSPTGLFEVQLHLSLHQRIKSLNPF